VCKKVTGLKLPNKKKFLQTSDKLGKISEKGTPWEDLSDDEEANLSNN
jgi:hypothetical protein